MGFAMRMMRLMLGLSLIAAQVSVQSREVLFTGPEIFPIDPRIEHLQSADFNQDGFEDVIVINPRRSRLQLLINQSEGAAAYDGAPEASSEEINELPADARFRIESISTEERVTSLVVTDFVGDPRPDVIYCGNLDEVICLENRGAKGLVEAKRWQVPAIVGNRHALQMGDFDGDSRPELCVLAESFIYVIKRSNEAGSVRPSRYRHSGDIKQFEVLDLNGDGRSDLLCQPDGNSTFSRIRFGGDAGLSVSESFVELGRNRFVGVTDPKLGMLTTISSRSGRAQSGKLNSAASNSKEENGEAAQLLRLATSSRQPFDRSVVWCDLDADGKTDFLMADSEAAQLAVALQGEAQRFGPNREYGVYGGVGQIAAADWDDNGQMNLFLLSYSENVVGVTEWQGEQGIAFPRAINLDGTAVGMTTGQLNATRGTELIILEKTDQGFGVVITRASGERRRVPVDIDVNAARVEIVVHDINQDGLMDLVLLAPYEELLVLLQRGDMETFEVQTISGAMRELERPWVGQADVDGDGKDELMVPQNNSVRALVLNAVDVSDEETRYVPQIKVQINGEENESVMGGVVVLSEGSGKPTILGLLDTGINRLTLRRRDASGQWELLNSLPLPRDDFVALAGQPAFLDGHSAMAISSRNGAYLQSISGDRWKFSVKGSYESQLTGGFLSTCIGADFDDDDEVELVFLETAKHHIELVRLSVGDRAQLQYRWPVFEERTFRSRRGERPEPREALVRDFTGDGKLDLALLVHDRVLLYPQR